MAKSALPPQRDLTIYLLKDDGRDTDDFVPKKRHLRHFAIGQGTGRVGDLFVQRPRWNAPRWASFFEEFVAPEDLGRTASVSGVFLVRTSGRVFATTFGQGRFLLADDCWEERFGLRVVLNSIAENSLRSVDKLTFDAASTHTRTQSNREASAAEFGLDVEQDLVRAVTGVPSDESLGRRLSGMDALHAVVRVDLRGFKALLRRYLEKFEDLSYRATFPWVDNIAQVKSETLADELDVAACVQINGDRERCWLAVPEIIDWSGVSGFRFAWQPRAPEHADIHIDDFIASFDDGVEITPHQLRHRRVSAVDADGNRIHEWSVFKCLNQELEHNGQTYVLSSGNWYRIDRGFVAAVNSAFAAAPRVELPLPEFAHASEGDYCRAAAQAAPTGLALLDQKFVSAGGRHGKVEVCDLMSTDRDLIHIKRYGASSVLSHLFAQGVVSAEVLRSEPDAQRQALDHLPERFRWEGELVPSEFRVVFAIVSDKQGELSLPFFSRVNMRQALRRVQAFGYRVGLAKISVTEVHAKRKKFQPR